MVRREMALWGVLMLLVVLMVYGAIVMKMSPLERRTALSGGPDVYDAAEYIQVNDDLWVIYLDGDGIRRAIRCGEGDHAEP